MQQGMGAVTRAAGQFAGSWWFRGLKSLPQVMEERAMEGRGAKGVKGKMLEAEEKGL